MYFGWQAAKAGRDAVQLAQTERHEIERERTRRQVERVGELVEEVFSVAYNDATNAPHAWRIPANKLNQALVGLNDRLPLCTVIWEGVSAATAMAAAAQGRTEVQNLLTALSREDG